MNCTQSKGNHQKEPSPGTGSALPSPTFSFHPKEETSTLPTIIICSPTRVLLGSKVVTKCHFPQGNGDTLCNTLRRIG